MKQHALLVTTGSEQTRGLDELNVRLQRGWRVVQMTPLGGAGAGPADGNSPVCLAALVIIEREEERAAEVMGQIEEEPEEVVEEIVEGDGTELPDELERERNGGER